MDAETHASASNHLSIYQCVSVEFSVCKTNNAVGLRTKSKQLNAYSVNTQFTSASEEISQHHWNAKAFIRTPPFFCIPLNLSASFTCLSLRSKYHLKCRICKTLELFATNQQHRYFYFAGVEVVGKIHKQYSRAGPWGLLICHTEQL